VRRNEEGEEVEERDSFFSFCMLFSPFPSVSPSHLRCPHLLAQRSMGRNAETRKKVEPTIAQSE